MINVTETAAEKINELLAEEAKLGAGLRVFVQGGGCSGFQYGLMIDEGEGDAESDQAFEVQGVRLFVDPISLRYLNGAEVDFVSNNMGGGFTIKNPNAKSTCGCGSSFSAERSTEAGRAARVPLESVVSLRPRMVFTTEGRFADAVSVSIRRNPPACRRPPLEQARLHRRCLPAPERSPRGR